MNSIQTTFLAKKALEWSRYLKYCLHPSLVASATQDEKWQWCVAETKKTKKQKTTKVG